MADLHFCDCSSLEGPFLNILPLASLGWFCISSLPVRSSLLPLKDLNPNLVLQVFLVDSGFPGLVSPLYIPFSSH